jgi:ribonuclease inhibitor
MKFDSENIVSATINFTNCKTVEEVHQMIQNILEFPNYYGKNLDALWDCLTKYPYQPNDITIVFQPDNCMNQELLLYIRNVIGIIIEVQKKYGDIRITVKN